MSNQFIMARVNSGDRLGLTLFFAIVLHAVVILGITFTPNIKKALDRSRQTMDITLVQSRSDKRPDDAQYLAQADHLGSGNTKEKTPPKAPSNQRRITPRQANGEAPDFQLAAAPPVSQKHIKKPEILTAKHADNQLAETHVNKTKLSPHAPTAAELLTRSMEIASLSAELKQQQAAYTGRKRHTRISASTQEFKYAAYMDTWRTKVERIGRLNYPEAAKKHKIYGALLLDVAINTDGSVAGISLRSSSGSKILDDAAIRIVKLAAPFAPLPDNIRADTDVLHILRTWIFKSGDTLYTK